MLTSDSRMVCFVLRWRHPKVTQQTNDASLNHIHICDRDTCQLHKVGGHQFSLVLCRLQVFVPACNQAKYVCSLKTSERM